MCVLYITAANISEDQLHNVSRDDIRDLFPGPETLSPTKNYMAQNTRGRKGKYTKQPLEGIISQTYMTNYFVAVGDV